VDSPEEETRKRFSNRTSALRTDVFRLVGLIRCKLTTWTLALRSHESGSKKRERAFNLLWLSPDPTTVLLLFHTEVSFRISFQSNVNFEANP
jgi:hypothetical protein